MKFSNNYIFYQENQSLDLAIKRFKDIAPENIPEEEETTNSTSFNYTHVLGNLGQQKFSIATLQGAKKTFESALLELDGDKEKASASRADMLENLGSVLVALGLHQNDIELLALSIDTFNKALEERSEKDTPEDWATTQNNLAYAMQALGEYDNKSKWLKEAAEANISALTVWTREQTPEEWSATMHDLGITFHIHGKLLKGNRTFQKSDVAYKNALSKRDEEYMRADRAMSHNNRGAVLQHIAEREQNAGRMEEALRAYEYSLSFWNEQLLPKPIATMIMANRSTARTTLAELTQDAAMAEEAADEFVLILELFSEACHAECLEHCRKQLEKAQNLVETIGQGKTA